MENNKITEFWDWFVAHQAQFVDIDTHNADILLQKLSNRLNRVQKGLTSHFGTNPETNEREYIISADGNVKLFPSVFAIVEQAPKLPHWTFVALKQRDRDIKEDWGIESVGINLTMKDIAFSYRANGDKLDIVFYIKIPKKSETDDTIIGMVFHMLDYLIGEYDVECRLGEMDFKPYGTHPSVKKIPLIELPNVVDSTSGVH